jgi:hypothetical protein
MKKSLLLSSIFLMAFFTVKAQIELIGVSNSPSSGMIDIVTWEALDSTTVQTNPTILEAYYLGSSAYNSLKANYYLTGISGDSSGLLQYDITNNTQTLSPYTNFTNISEFDMSTGRIYNLQMDSTGYISVNEYIIKNGQDSLIGVIYEPGVEGLIVDAIGFNSNDGILYYAGYTNDPAVCLYSVSVREENFSFSKTILNTTAFASNITGLNYDNVNDRLFAMSANFDSLGNYLLNEVVEIDTLTGDVTALAELSGFEAFVVGSSSFDQFTGSYLVVGVDTTFNISMIVFDIYTNTFTTGYVPGFVSEIVCDNNAFALAYYTTTSLSEVEQINFSIYPNPVADKLFISGIFDEVNTQIRIFNMEGRLIREQQVSGSTVTQIDVGGFIPGNYIIQLISGTRVDSQKVIIR